MNTLEKFTDEELFAIFGSDIEAEIKSRGYEYGWHKQVKYAGEIYILVNPAFPNLVKIGYADNVAKRVKTLNSNSGLPDPYHIYATYKVKKRLEDLKLHKLIDSLDSDLRHAKNKEFYEMTPEKAYGILSAIAEINGDEDLLVLNPMADDFFTEQDSEDAPSPRVKLRPRMTFPALNIPMGATLVFAEDETITCTVNGRNTVAFEGKSYKLSALTRMLKKRNGTGNASGAYQGGLYFTYDGRRLTDIRNEMDKLQQIESSQ